MNGFFAGDVSGVMQGAAMAHAGNQVKSVTSALGAAGADRERVRKAGDDFESVFISQMIKPMFEGIEVDSLFGGGAGEETWRGMLVDEYGKILSRAGGVGISAEVQKTLIQMQEGSI